MLSYRGDKHYRRMGYVNVYMILLQFHELYSWKRTRFKCFILSFSTNCSHGCMYQQDLAIYFFLTRSLKSGFGFFFSANWHSLAQMCEAIASLMNDLHHKVMTFEKRLTLYCVVNADDL